jgi:hypothetical protein
MILKQTNAIRAKKSVLKIIRRFKSFIGK